MYSLRVLILSLVCLLQFSQAKSYGEEIGFLEQFAIGGNRSVALAQLVPGTEAYYYYHCLHLQNTGDYAAVKKMLTPWIGKYKLTTLVREIKLRQALLTYNDNPVESLKYLKTHLGLGFNHQRDITNQKNAYSSALDPALLAQQRLLDIAFSRYNNLQGLEHHALYGLDVSSLDSTRRRHLLQRLTHPDFPGLAKLIVADMKVNQFGGFGTYNIHKQLLPSQLEECLVLAPELLTQSNFVNIYISKLHPSNDLQWAKDNAAHIAYLDRLWNFVAKLAPVHNSLKAHVLYRRLVLDRSQGVYNAERFMAYLKLPRNAFYVNPEYVKDAKRNRYLVNFNANYSPITLLPTVGRDEPLIRSYLDHFFTDSVDYKSYAPYLHDNYLKEVFAESKITHGVGNPNHWSPLLSAAKYQALRQRIDLDFAYTSPTTYTADAKVFLEVDVKNVKKLIVKIYELNAQNFYRQQLQAISTSINLDGLVPNHERSLDYAVAPLLRVRHKFEFPELSKPGVYVVDFIGNGISSRAMIIKGRLDFIVRTTTAGQMFQVIDSNKKVVKTSELWVGGAHYTSNGDGEILVPFSTNAGLTPVVISDGQISTLHQFNHEAEKYSLSTGISIDRESLLQRKLAPVMIRAGLKVNGTPTTLSVVEDVTLTITSVDIDGTQSNSVVSDFKLREAEETVHLFRVPQRLKTIQFVLSGNVKNLSTGKTDRLSASSSYSVNGINRTEKIASMYLGRTGKTYVVDMLGKSGEARIGRTIRVTLKHRDFVETVTTVLATDAKGRIVLGELVGVDSITVVDATGVQEKWNLVEDASSFYQSRHAAVGSTIRVRYMGSAEEISRDEVALFAVRGNTYTKDHFSAISLADGVYSIKGLLSGDYELLLRSSARRISIKVTDAKTVTEGYLLGTNRHLELRGDSPLQIVDVNRAEEQVKIRFVGANEYSRVHVIASRYYPRFPAWTRLRSVVDAEPFAIRTIEPTALYVEGRDIGDEYRYIIDRRYARKFPGNLLARPELLLNPWPIRTTETAKQTAEVGDDFQSMANALEESSVREGQTKGATGGYEDFSTLDFLPVGSVLLSNLEVGEDGFVNIQIADLAGHHHLQIVAVGPTQTVARSVSFAEKPREILDLRLIKGLDNASHFLLQKQVSLVAGNQEFVIDDISSSRFKTYDSLSSIYQLYGTLQANTALQEFGFLMKWPTYDGDKKRALYSKYACHELGFFLYNKDRKFFDEVVLPHLLHKQHKTFMDDWLVGRDLKGYLIPWKYEQLNVVERVLLGRHVNTERVASERHLQDLWDLVPPNIDQSNMLFETALFRGGLSADDELLSVADSERNLEEKRGLAARRQLVGGGGMGGQFGGVAGQLDAALGKTAAQPVPLSVGKLKEMADKRTSDMNMLQRERKKAVSDQKSRYRGDRDAGQKDGLFYAEIDKMRTELRTLYREQEKTREWVENNYYQLPIQNQGASLVSINGFWNDWATHREGGFRSPHLAQASRNFTEMMLALAVIDLPFEAEEVDIKMEGQAMRITSEGPMIVFHEEVNPVEMNEKLTPILVSQNYFRHGDRFIQVGNEKRDKFITDEFLVQTVYGCEIVVTNPSSSARKLDVLFEIPVGAIPVLSGHKTNSEYLRLEGYNTKTIEFYFYFPAVGTYSQFPVHASSSEQLLASADAVGFNVVKTLSKIDTTSWAYVSQNGSDEEVLKYLENNNVHNLNLTKIAFRMRDKSMFQRTTSLLKSRHQYDHTLWSYAVLQDLPSEINHYLDHENKINTAAGYHLVSPLLTIDPVMRRNYEHMEYRPLVNARAHQLGAKRQILNDRFAAQYNRLLKLLSYKQKLTSEDYLAAVYYLLLQDRIEEAIDQFALVDTDQIATRLQYDYFACYLALSQGDVKTAKTIAVKYGKYPVDRWRKIFDNVVQQVDEIGGDDAGVTDADDQNRNQTQLAATEPGFDFKVESGEVIVDYQNLSSIKVNYYEIDIELLFSRNPFVQNFSGGFSFIKPNHSDVIELAATRNSHKLTLPNELKSRNVLVEIVGAGQTQTRAYYSHALAVQVIQKYGQVQVLQAKSRQPLGTVYVKVYSQQKDGGIKFYKDGYTDLRGRFDYASLSTGDLESVAKFSLLISSKNNGSMVREAMPPLR
ncbi:MAG: hypothetical protein HOB73_15265 [Planctomycetaceae bacterium]|nr:hypothetical protein [Planctomycetaceae bacterium]